jgi:hypothetical protein
MSKKILKFEGHDYEILPEEIAPGVSRAVRPGKKPKGKEAIVAWRAATPNSEVGFATADLKDSGEGWFYLPRRVGPPLGGDVLEGKDGKPDKWLIQPHPLRDIIRQHPLWIAGRDDLARKRVEDALANA